MITFPYETLKVRIDEDICFVQISRPQANNAIDQILIEEFTQLLDAVEKTVKVLVIEGTPEVFCTGADFQQIQSAVAEGGTPEAQDPGPLYDLWTRLATGPFISLAHVRGKANAGGIGFVSACDIVIADDRAQFSLSELLFGLMPACVLPFLIRRIGFSWAHYLTLTTQPIAVQQALEWGLVDASESNSEQLLRKQLLRLRRLNKVAISRYKSYMSAIEPGIKNCRSAAIEANLEVFSDKNNLDKISRYVQTGRFPWEVDS